MKKRENREILGELGGGQEVDDDQDTLYTCLAYTGLCLKEKEDEGEGKKVGGEDRNFEVTY